MIFQVTIQGGQQENIPRARTMLTEEQKTLITDHRTGRVTTVNVDGTPSVSPMATL